MLGGWRSIGTTPFNRRNIRVSAADIPGCPGVRSTPGSARSAARPTGIGRAPTPNAARKRSGRAVSRRPTTKRGQERPPRTPEEPA